jgi:hypothetical protein
MALGSIRRWVSLVAVSAAVAVAASGGASSGAAVVLPVVTVTPSTGLVDLQKVTVTGSGFSANAQVATVQCRSGAIGEADCDLGTLVYQPADSNGAFTLSRYVRRLIQVGATTIDCGAPAGCILGAGNIADLSEANGQTIFFNPNIPPKVPAATVTPNTNLVDHQLVTVAGKGYAPESSVYLSQCIVHPPAGTFGVCDYATQRYETADSNGKFTATNFVLERRQVAYTETGIRIIDCAAAPGTCDIEVRSFGIGSSVPVKVALTFDPNVAPAVALAHVTPNSSLRDLDSVIVTGTGFTPGVAVDVVECTRPPAGFPSCDYTTGRAITAGLHGEFSFTFSVRRHIAAFSSPNGATNFDCGAIRRSCALTIRGSETQPTISRGLTFNPRLSAVVPAIIIDPKYDLRDNQSIAVTLHGFTPNQPVRIVECSGEAITENDLSYCDYTTVQTGTPTVSDLRTRFTVRAVVGGQGGLVDCRTKRGACVLIAAASEGDYYGVGVAASPLAGTTPPAFTDQSAGALAPKAAAGSSLPNIAFRKLAFLP